MNRKRLISAVQEICSSKGYEFRVLDSAALSSMSSAMPAAVLIQPKFHSIEGHNHGHITYKVKLSLLREGRKLSPEERASAVAFMEQSLLDIVEALSDTPLVAAVEELTISACSPRSTPHGAIGACATAQIVTIF